MKNSTNEDNVTYIVVYEYLNTWGDWEDVWTEWDTYDDLIEWCARRENRAKDEFDLTYIFKTDTNMLDLFREDIDKRVFEMEEEVKERAFLEKKRKEEQRVKHEKEKEAHEYELYKKLCRKYGNGEN